MAKSRKSTRSRKPKARIPAEIQQRLGPVRAFLERRRLDGFLITSRTDQVYQTGFNGEDGMALVTPRQVYLLSDFRFQETACKEAPWARFVMRKKGLPEELAKLARRGGMERIGFVADRITVATAAQLRKALRPCGTKLSPVTNVLTGLRQKKDPSEIAVIRQAVRIAEEAFRAVRRSIRIGQTELELAHRLNYEMGRRGASGPSFPIVVGEGPNSALPHAEPGTRTVKRGSAILLDWGARFEGYRSDLTRVLFVGRIPTRFRRLYRIVLDAQRRAIQTVRAGRVIREVDDAARSYIAKCGYGKQFGHALGHGLGLDIHEAPSLNTRNSAPLESGMVITIEPGIYVPGLGGVRIEDDVLVTDEGCEVLSTLPKALGGVLLDL